jgi:light-regulated signal transduction histidine kinase (bacteriophytochrome)
MAQRGRGSNTIRGIDNDSELLVSDTDILEEPIVAMVRKLEAQNARLQEALQAANLEIDSLTYSIAHDLRTPLMHIDGFAQLLQSSTGAVLDHESREHLERIISATRAMNDLIGALIDYSRVNSAELTVDDADLEELLEEALEQVRPWSNGRKIEWHRTRLPVVRGDIGLLRQVLVNLVANAVKYTRPRDPAVIEIGTRTDQGSDVVVFVRDNGVGFDLKYASRLFTPFQRMHSADAFRGIGMGLAKVRRIMTRHGGKAWADSAVGSGSTFFVSMPRDRDE